MIRNFSFNLLRLHHYISKSMKSKPGTSKSAPQESGSPPRVSNKDQYILPPMTMLLPFACPLPVPVPVPVPMPVTTLVPVPVPGYKEAGQRKPWQHRKLPGICPQPSQLQPSTLWRVGRDRRVSWEGWGCGVHSSNTS